MKKIFAGLLLAVCLLTACGKAPKPEVMTEDPLLAVTTSAATEPLTESTEAEKPITEEPSTTEMETSEIATEATTESTMSPTEVTATTEPTTEKDTQPTTAPSEATAPPTTTPPTTTPTTTVPTEPPTTEPPAPTETQPPETEPPTTEAPKEVIDLAALEEYGRAYARTLGYNGNPNTGFATNAGYFPPSYVLIRTMEEGYRHVKELVDAQYADDIGGGHDIVVVIDGVERHRKLNIYIEPTDKPDLYLMYCFYGGE